MKTSLRANFKENQKENHKSNLIVKTIVLLTLAVLTAFTAACGTSDKNTNDNPVDGVISAQSSPVIPIDIGEGSTSFIFEIKDDKDDITVWRVHTDELTVGDALLKLGMIQGDSFDFGLMVSHVNGIRADFMEDNAWWAFYIDGEMAMAGVDATEIQEGVIYAFIHTPA